MPPPMAKTKVLGTPMIGFVVQLPAYGIPGYPAGKVFVTVLTTVAELFVTFGSNSLAKTWKVFVRLPAAVGCTTTWTEVFVPSTSEPRFTSKTPLDGVAPPVAETKVTLAGS